MQQRIFFYVFVYLIYDDNSEGQEKESDLPQNKTPTMEVSSDDPKIGPRSFFLLWGSIQRNRHESAIISLFYRIRKLPPSGSISTRAVPCRSFPKAIPYIWDVVLYSFSGADLVRLSLLLCLVRSVRPISCLTHFRLSGFQSNAQTRLLLSPQPMDNGGLFVFERVFFSCC